MDNCTVEDIENALSNAHLLEFIQALPEGMNTFVGDRGLKLSGGEKQRLALARLFLKKPQICIFDECTSALDENTAQIIQDNIEKFLPNRIKIIITHRPVISNKATQIIRLSKKDNTDCVGIFHRIRPEYANT